MPCTSDYEPTRKECLDEKAPAMLCAVMGALTEEQLMIVLRLVNWKEAGVTSAELLEWWKIHKREDEKRRKEEEAERKRWDLVRKVMDKLTTEEKLALSLELGVSLPDKGGRRKRGGPGQPKPDPSY